MSEETEVKKRNGCMGWLWRFSVFALLLVVGLVFWLDGPGLRWLGPKVGMHYLEKAGFSGGFEIAGSLMGGVEVRNLALKSEGTVAVATVDRLALVYDLEHLKRRTVESVSGKGIHVELRLGEGEEKESEELDLAGLGELLEDVRERVVPIGIVLEDLSFSASKDGERAVELGKSGLRHEAGSGIFELSMEEVIDAAGRRVEAQRVEIVWEERAIRLDELKLLPILGLRAWVVNLSEEGVVSGEGQVALDEGVLSVVVGDDLQDVRVELWEGTLDVATIADCFGVDLDGGGRVSSLAVEVVDVLPDWKSATGRVELIFEDGRWDKWELSEAVLGVDLGLDGFKVALSGRAMGSGFRVDAEGLLGREDFVVDGLGGVLGIDAVDDVLLNLKEVLEMELEVEDFPGSSLAGSWKLDLADGFGGVEADLVLSPVDEGISALRLKARYAGDKVLVERLELDGVVFSGNYDIDSNLYEGELILDGFESRRVDGWARGLGLDLGGRGEFSGRWKGGGNLVEKTHRGELSLTGGSWERAVGDGFAEAIEAAGEFDYAWPGRLGAQGMSVRSGTQRVDMDVVLEEGKLVLERLLWMDGEVELAEGKGSLPIPEDFGKWQEFISEDGREMDFEVQSRELPFSVLKQWLGEVEGLDERMRLKLGLKLTRSFAQPSVDGVLEVKDIRAPNFSELPTMDLKVALKAVEGRARLEVEVLAADFPPTTAVAEMAFTPALWAEDIETLKAEVVSAKVDLPQLEISRFAGLVPGIRVLNGVATGNVEVSGSLGEPVISGRLQLRGGRVEMMDDMIPVLAGVEVDIDATTALVNLEARVASVAGGTLRMDGKLDLRDGGLGELDVRVRGDALPVLRNEFLLMRANADLRLAGLWADARLTGSVGIVDSIFFKDFELLPIGTPFLAPSAAALPKMDTQLDFIGKVPAPFSNWGLDVAVTTVDPILVRGNLGKGQVDVGLRIGGTLGNPLPNGRVRLRDAQARLPFSTLRVSEGLLIFSPQTGFDPVIELRGNAEPRPYRVRIQAYGRLSDPQLVLTSEPPLPENEIMTLLVTGATTSGLEDPQAASSRALQLLVEELRRGRFLFGDRLRPVLGLLDNVDFSLSEADPYDGDRFSSATLELHERWFVSAGVGDDGNQRVMLIWRLGFR